MRRIRTYSRDYRPPAAQILTQTESDSRRVERELRVRELRAKKYTSIVMPWRCATCLGGWTEAGSYALGRCTRCGTERPVDV